MLRFQEPANKYVELAISMPAFLWHNRVKKDRNSVLKNQYLTQVTLYEDFS